jgi:hypothetical protein
MCKTLLVWALAILAILEIPAWADTVDYQFTQIAAVGQGNSHFEFPQFNPALGELTNLGVSFSVRFNGALTFTNNSDTSGSYQFNFIPKFIITNQPNGLLGPYAAPFGFVGIVGSVSPRSSVTTPYNSFAARSASLTGGFNPFVGNGVWTIDGFESMDMSLFPNWDQNLTMGWVQNPTPFDTRVTYSYDSITPIVTESPEPAFYSAIALLLAGMLTVRRLYRVR